MRPSWLAILVSLVLAAGEPARGEVTHQDAGERSDHARPPPPPPPPPPAVAAKTITFEGSPCRLLARVGEMPSKAGVAVADPYFNAIKDSGKAAVACLVEEIDNEARMPDPRCAARVADFRVGDLAFFLLSEFGYVGFDDPLPPGVRKETARIGAQAYFDWVNEPGNRRLLQQRVRALLESRAAGNSRK